MSLRKVDNIRNVTRVWLLVISGSTCISLADALPIYGYYGCTAFFDGTQESAALLLIQCVSLVVLLPVAGLSQCFSACRIPEKQGLSTFILITVVLAVLGNFVLLDYTLGAFQEIHVALPRSFMAFFTIMGITISAVWVGRFLDRRGWTGLRSVFTNEHVILALPFAIAMMLVAFSEMGDRMAALRWHQPMFIGLAAALLLAAFIPVTKRWPLLGKCVILTVGCFGISMAPLASQSSRISDSWRVETPAGAPQHVLLVTVDTLRADSLSCYGATDNRTPAIDELAAQSVVFANASSPSSWTVPAVSSILTGLSPLTHQVNTGGRIDDHITTIAERFAAHGYRTGAIVNNPLLSPNAYNYEQGFHRYSVFPSRQSERVSCGLRLLWRLFPNRWPAVASTTGLTEQAIRWYDRHRDERTFLWLHYLDPHTPFEPPSIFLDAEDREDSVPDSFNPFYEREDGPVRHGMRGGNDLLANLGPEDRRWIRNLYLAEVRYVDAELGRLMDFLEEGDLDLLDDMLVVFASDHGEEMWDHEKFGHGHSMYRELLDVPFMIKMPQQTRQILIDARVSTLDLSPTIADICRLTVDENDWDGRSLREHWESSDTPPEAVPLISALNLYMGEQRSISFEGYKLISNVTDGTDEVYALGPDPHELHDIAPEVPRTVLRLKGIFSDAEATAEATRARLGLTDSPAAHGAVIKEAMEALGYL